MYNDTNKTEHLELGLADRFERDDAFLQDEVDRVTNLNLTIVERIDRLKTQSEEYVLQSS
jgi:hypothetical protein